MEEDMRGAIEWKCKAKDESKAMEDVGPAWAGAEGRSVYSYRFNGSKLDVITVQARIIEITRHFDILALPMTPSFKDSDTSMPIYLYRAACLQYIVSQN